MGRLSIGALTQATTYVESELMLSDSLRGTLVAPSRWSTTSAGTLFGCDAISRAESRCCIPTAGW